MAGGQQGVGQDASLQLVGMAFGVRVFVHSLFPVSVSLSQLCWGAGRCLLHHAQTVLGEVNEGSVVAGLALRLLVVYIRASFAMHEPYLTRLIFAL